jgi:hypothetical protein
MRSASTDSFRASAAAARASCGCERNSSIGRF